MKRIGRLAGLSIVMATAAVAVKAWADAPPAAPAAEHGAALGVTTRTPKATEIEPYGLGPVEIRVRGRIIDAIDKGGPAEKAGLLIGDALIALDRSELFSNDDVMDFLLVSREGRHVAAHIRKRDDPFGHVVEVVLAASSAEIPKGNLVWQYAGLGQYEEALAAAKKDGKRVLVGLSGADT